MSVARYGRPISSEDCLCKLHAAVIVLHLAISETLFLAAKARHDSCR
jgi:hypothetical protein